MSDFLSCSGVCTPLLLSQRARRYRAAKSAGEAAKAAADDRRQQNADCVLMNDTAKIENNEDQPLIPADTTFDSNCISPGTEFMAAFFRHLRFFCEKKLNEDPKWRGLKVLLSGPDVPGLCILLRCTDTAVYP